MKSLLPIRISIGYKIFGLPLSLLALLAVVMVINHRKMKLVHEEVTDLAAYILPIKNHVTAVDRYALKQEIHFERILYLYENKPLDLPRLRAELSTFKHLGTSVDDEIHLAVGLSDTLARSSRFKEDVIQFARLSPLLRFLEKDHQEFENQAEQILAHLRRGNEKEAGVLDAALETREQAFDERLHRFHSDLAQHTQKSADRIEHHEQILLWTNGILSALAALMGLVLGLMITVRLVNPIHRLVKSAREVQRGNLKAHVDVLSRDEVGTLAGVFNTMVGDVRQKDTLKQAFGEYIDPRIVEIVTGHQQTGGTVDKQVMTVFYSDLARFSTVSELLTPTGLVKLINQYFTLATEPIAACRGVVDKLIGDAIVAFWGPPFVDPDEQARLACIAALEQITQLKKLRRQLPDIMGIRKGLPNLDLRIGLDSGEVVVGNIGTERAKSYTIIGNAVETAEYLEEANKRYGTRILISDRTRKLAGEEIITRRVDRLPIGEVGALMPIYELLGYGADVEPADLKIRDFFERGLASYEARRWHHARSQFETCLNHNPNDGPSRFYLARLDALESETPQAQGTRPDRD